MLTKPNDDRTLLLNIRVKTLIFVYHTTLAKSLGGQPFLSERRVLSTRFRVKFVPISLKKSDTDLLSFKSEDDTSRTKE